MAELIQKKLQGEVEKYQQLQKGKRAELVWSCPCPLSTLMRRRAPSEGRKGGYCVQRTRYPLFLPRNHSPQNCAVPGPFDVSNRVFPLTIPDLSKSMSGRQKLESQLTENNIVKEELALLDGSNVVFKLLGPVLVKQELGEARATVGKRLDYITAEM